MTSVVIDLRLWMHTRCPRLLEGKPRKMRINVQIHRFVAFYRSCENHPDSPCWHRTWDEKVIKELHKDINERTTR